MKRTTAREIAVQLGFYASASDKPVSEIIDEFFDEEYFATLAGEDELFAEYPEKKQKEYIIRIAENKGEKSMQIDKDIKNRHCRTALCDMRSDVHGRYPEQRGNK